MTSPTPRLGMSLVEGTDSIGGAGGLQDKVNSALQRIDKAAGYFLCTSTTRPVPPDTFPGMMIREMDTRIRRVRNPSDTGWLNIEGDQFPTIGSGTVRATKPLRALGTDTQHSAFPAILCKQDGEVICVYRQGSDHINNRDGILRIIRSSNFGRSWTNPVTLLTIAGQDLRDPGLSESADGTKVWLTYCKTTAAVPFNGVYFRTSTDGGVTFGAETRIDNVTSAACCAPIVELDNGTLLMPWYGLTGGEVWRSVWVAKSTNGGATWTHTRINNGQTDGRHYEEPYIARKPGTQILVMAHRWGSTTSIGVSTSTDNAANWSASAEKFPGTGKPALFWINDNTLGIIYRALSNQTPQGWAAHMRVSRNNGSTWYPRRLVDHRWSQSGWMSYADATPIQPGVCLVALGRETASSFSRLLFTCVGEAGASTPFGVLPHENTAVANNDDQMLFATNFDQPDGSLAYPWSVYAGDMKVVDGEAQSEAADATQDYARIYVNTAQVEVEAEFLAQSTGTNTGYGIMFRMVDAATYLFWTNETLGTRLRLYKFSAGTPTSLGEVVTTTKPDTWHRLKVVARDDVIRLFWDDTNVLNLTLSSGDYATYGGGYVGFTTWTRTDGSLTKCRSFSVRG